MTIGLLARRRLESERKNAPPQKFAVGDLVHGNENVALLGTKLEPVTGLVSRAKYTTVRGPVDFDWLYDVVNKAEVPHILPEAALVLVRPATDISKQKVKKIDERLEKY